jgi:hypothetical protein
MRISFSFLLAFFAFWLFSCSSSDEESDSWEFESKEIPPDLLNNLENTIVIKYNNGSPPTIKNSHNEVTITPDDENVKINVAQATNTEYNLIVGGTAKNGSLKIYGDYKIGLYLNGVNITNPKGPAINIQNGKQISVSIWGKNYLADGADYENSGIEDAKGTFFSEGQLVFSGGGSLEVKAKYGHAIVTDDFFEIESGGIIVQEAEKDGIHANDEIFVKGGNIKITSKGDAIQNENLPIRISGGKIVAQTSGIKSHGISSGDSTVISGTADVNINVSGNGSKGIKSKGFVAIKGGMINIKTKGTKDIDKTVIPADTSKVAGIKADGDMDISGGTLTIESSGSGGKGMSADGNIVISGGDVSITADDDGIKANGDLLISGGNIYVKSYKKKAIDCDGNERIEVEIEKIDKGGASGF